MWNKKESEPTQTKPAAPTQRSAEGLAKPQPTIKTPGGSSAVIGSSISIKGDLSGEEDLIIEGRVEGEIRLREHSVTVGRSGRIKANVFGKNIQVEGEVHGNLTGDNEVVIRNTGRVEGNIVAPRVTLEDGSSFRGAIDMQAPQKPQHKTSPTTKKNDRPQRRHSGSKPTSSDDRSGDTKATRTSEANV